MLADYADEELFDEAQIGMLRDAVGPEDLLAMLSELPPAAANSLAAIADALTASDIVQARRSAHILKGCAGTFGAARLAAIACEIELELTAIEAMRQRMPALIEALDRTTAALRRVAGVTSEDGCEP